MSFRWMWLALALSGCTKPPARPEASNQASPAAVHRVVVRHALMTWVMDSPAGQRDKARTLVEGSKLVEAIRARRYEVEVRFDAAAGDDVIVERLDGRELGRVDLHAVGGGATPAQILDQL